MNASTTITEIKRWDVRCRSKIEGQKGVFFRPRVLSIKSYRLPDFNEDDETINEKCDEEEEEEEVGFNPTSNLSSRSLTKICILKRTSGGKNHAASISEFDNSEENSFDKSFLNVLSLSDSQSRARKVVGKKAAKKAADEYTTDLSDFKIINNGESKRSKHCHVRIHHRRDQKCFVSEQTIIFTDRQQAQEFCDLILIHENMILESQRSAWVLLAPRLSICDDYETFSKKRVELLIEIVGVVNLPTPNKDYMPCPYVEVKLSDTVIHRTKYIVRELNPIWTLKNKSYFILSLNGGNFLRCENKLSFTVYDKKSLLSEDEPLVGTCVPLTSLYSVHESRVEYNLRPIGQKTAKIAIRCRHATDHDNFFLETYIQTRRERKKHYVKSKKSIVLKGSLVVSTRKKTISKDGTKVVHMKVQPYPDPSRREMTTWMTKKEIDAELYKPSIKWNHSGSGQLAIIYLEILQCNGLPNVDIGQSFGNKTDAFVKLAYEDCIRQTDVVKDFLSPRWMPWTNRAFTLRMVHPSSQLFLGVHNANVIFFPDFIGQTVVDIKKLRPETEYVLDYDLFDSLVNPARKKMGTIKIRVRIRVDNQRAVVLASLSIPDPSYLNESEISDFRVTQNTIKGNDDMYEYSIKHTLTLLEEIGGYIKYTPYISNAVYDLIMWECDYHFEIPVPRSANKVAVAMPFNSIIAFICTTTLVENFALFPSYLCLFCGWIFIAVLNWQRNHPDPWATCIGFSEILYRLVTGLELEPVRNISKNKTKESVDEFDAIWAKRVEVATTERLLRRERKLKKRQWRREERMVQVEVAEELRHKKVGYKEGTMDRMSRAQLNDLCTVRLLKPRVYPIQLHLLYICEQLRIWRNILTWQECYFTFWISSGCFISAIIFFFVPWGFIMRWLARLSVWALFGPWIKLGILFSKSKEICRKLEQWRFFVCDAEKRKYLAVQKWDKTSQKFTAKLRRAREKALKLICFKQYLFGSYMVEVPKMNMNRFTERPLSSSTATFLKFEGNLTFGEIAMKEDVGQILVGEMVPHLKQQVRCNFEAQPGEAILRKYMLKKEETIANVSTRSDLVDDMKIILIVLIAGTVTLICVPMILSVRRFLMICLAPVHTTLLKMYCSN